MPVVAQFEHWLKEIKMLVYDRLNTTVEEENQKQDQLSLIIAKEQKTSTEVKALKEELEKAKRERNGEINKKVTRKLESRSKQKEDFEIKSSKERVNFRLNQTSY